MRCTSISADSIVSGLITRFISLQHALLNDERFLPAEKQRGFWSMNGRTPASVTAGRSAECHNAGSSPFLLFGRNRCQSAAAFRPGVETMDEQANRRRTEISGANLAERILRSCVALKQELQSEMGIRERKSCAGRIGSTCRPMGVARSDRRTAIVAGRFDDG